MPAARSDASTSTDDLHLQGRPLCLFYFSEPFAVLSATPPRVSPLPPGAAMSPPAPAPHSSYAGSSSSRPSFDLGAATVHRRPLQLVSLDLSRDTLSSSLFASDVWFDSSSGSREPRRPAPAPAPCSRLPPLRLPVPTPKDSYDFYSSDDVLPVKCRNPVKFMLPPISLPTAAPAGESSVESGGRRGEAREAAAAAAARSRRAPGVRKNKSRARLSGVRRMLTGLMQRTVKGRRECSTPALQEVLATIREAWPEPRSLLHQRPTSSSSASPPAARAAPAVPTAPAANMRTQLAELPPRPGASPGLLRRRYSVPETIMRKYRLAQLNSDGEECGASSAASRALSPASPSRGACSGSGSCGEAARLQRRDRELMRKSALMRRLWGRGCRCHAPPAPRSLDSSRAELRLEPRGPLSPLSPGWTTPKRQRLGSPDASHGSDEMLRAAMRNSFERSELSERRARLADSSDAPLSDSRTSHSPSEDSGGDPASSQTACRCGSPPPAAPASPPPPASLSRPAHIDVRVSEAPDFYESQDQNVLPYVRPPDTPSYDVLEIVVSETFNSAATSELSSLPALKILSPDRLSASTRTASAHANVHGLDIDEYVSHILVESLNSLTDQIESMNASIGGDRKISIVEKEIKVKLQNAGVNTIVHLSPTSNHQIIFGNEELCNRDERDTAESNNNLTASVADTPPSQPPPLPPLAADDYANDNYEEASESHDQVNQAVLQQIQKLFQEELRSLGGAELEGAGEVRHVEISNVDVYVQQHSPLHSMLADTIELRTQRDPDPADHEAMAGLGAGNYYESARPPALVARRTALPHTASMEVNTSSSSEGSLGSCASLVDSLDDPASPRAPPRRSLARSAVDVLELLPEGGTRAAQERERSEAFFIRIDDEGEGGGGGGGGVVADRMPESLRSRLLRRQRRRELRAECARHTRAKQLRRELERQRRADQRRLDLAAAAALDALLGDIVTKVAQDEINCLKIKHKTNAVIRKSNENLTEKRNWKKSNESLPETNSRSSKNSYVQFTKTQGKENNFKNFKEKPQIHGKLSLPAAARRSPEPAPRRLYQKSEIHEGNKCIEILEILEYVDTTPSSPETSNTDENHFPVSSKRKSRIPVPIYEKIQRIPKLKSYNDLSNSDLEREHESDAAASRADATSRLLASMLLQSLAPAAPATPSASPAPAARRASVPQQEPRSRSNSLKFKRVFDIIPEEKSSLSVESSAEDVSHCPGRRVSAPAPASPTPPAPPAPCDRSVKHASTSPLSRFTKNATTSPLRRSAATSPAGGVAGGAAGGRAGGGARAWLGLGTRKEGSKEQSGESEKTSGLKSASTQYSAGRSTVRTIEAGGREPAVVVGRRRPPERPKNSNKSKADATAAAGARHKRRERDSSMVRSLSEPGGGGVEVGGGGGVVARGAGEEGSSSESGSSLLCALAPRWLSRGRRRRREPDDARHTDSSVSAAGSGEARAGAGTRAEAAPPGWSVTVAGAGRAQLPADLQMRLSFPPPPNGPAPPPAGPAPHHHSDSGYGDDCRQQRHTRRQMCWCRRCAECPCLPPAHPAHSLALRKLSTGSSILGDKSSKRPELPAVGRATRTHRSVKMRRGCSPHCWLPDAPLSAWSGSEGGLAVLGAALVPRRKPRRLSNTERSLPAPQPPHRPPLHPPPPPALLRRI